MNAPITDATTAGATALLDGQISSSSDHDDWPALLVFAHVRMAGLIRENHQLRDDIEQMTAVYCGTCGARPCANPSFCEACRRADQNRKRGRA